MAIYADRIERLSGILASRGLDALALNPGPSLFYMTGLGFHLMERPVLALFAAGGKSAIVLARLEMEKLADCDIPLAAFPYGEDPELWENAFRDALDHMKLVGKRIGIEGGSLRLLEYRFLMEASGRAAPENAGRSRLPESEIAGFRPIEARFPEASDAVGALRARKSADEIGKIRGAVGMAESAMEATLALARIGMTEREFASELTMQLIRAGSDPGRTGSPIVSCGPRAADPHASPSDKAFSPGELLVVDWGASNSGYGSDLTRTFAIGGIDARSAEIHAIVERANAAGRAAGGPGVSCHAVDAAAREVIARSGYGTRFTHRTGHGIGLEGHEAPYIREGNPQLLEAGMVYTVEPGIYLPGLLGVRIEDDMAVTATGVECLSAMPRTVRVIG